jgi:hypothetical protein
LFCEYAVGSERGQRPLRRLYDRREALVDDLKRRGKAAHSKRGKAKQTIDRDR